MISLSSKTEGGSSPSGGKCTFGGRQKFLADGVAGGAKILQGEKKKCWFDRIFKNFLFESKNKKVCYFKVGQFEIF